MKNTSERAGIRESISPLRQVLFPVCAISIISGIVIATVGGSKYLHAERMRTEVARIADANKDSISTHDEWVAVYDELKQSYNGMEGADLSSEQLREYIQSREYASENSK